MSGWSRRVGTYRKEYFLEPVNIQAVIKNRTKENGFKLRVGLDWVLGKRYLLRGWRGPGTAVDVSCVKV